MILWITGKANAGKTTLANKIAGKDTVILDADVMRGIWTDLKFSISDRLENCSRLAMLAKTIELQGFQVIVTAIAPLKSIRKRVYEICGCDFIYITGGTLWEKTEYEIPENATLKIKGNESE